MSRSLLFFVEIRARLVPMVLAGSLTVLIMKKKKKNENRNLSEELDPFCNLNAVVKNVEKWKRAETKWEKETEENIKRRKNYRQAMESLVLGVQPYTTLTSILRKYYQQGKKSSFPIEQDRLAKISREIRAYVNKSVAQ